MARGYKQKFHYGNIVRVKKFTPWAIGKMGKVLSYRTGHGELAQIRGSYADRCGSNDMGSRSTYTLHFKRHGTISWYDEGCPFYRRSSMSKTKNRGTKAPPVVEKVRIDNTELVSAFKAEGGAVIHLVPTNRIFNRRGRPEIQKTRGMTLAFVVKGKRMVIATALTHPNDTFSKKHGTRAAIAAFREGKVVVLPAFEHPISDLRYAFGQLV